MPATKKKKDKKKKKKKKNQNKKKKKKKKIMFGKGIFDITNRNTTTVPAEGNSSKRHIVFNNCQVTNNKNKIFLKTTNKRYYLFSQCSK
jgi:hypothetical protein